MGGSTEEGLISVEYEPSCNDLISPRRLHLAIQPVCIQLDYLRRPPSLLLVRLALRPAQTRWRLPELLKRRSTTLQGTHTRARQPKTLRISARPDSLTFIDSLGSLQSPDDARMANERFPIPATNRLATLPIEALNQIFAHALAEAVTANDSLPSKGAITRFHSKQPPPLEIGAYLSRCASSRRSVLNPRNELTLGNLPWRFPSLLRAQIDKVHAVPARRCSAGHRLSQPHHPSTLHRRTRHPPDPAPLRRPAAAPSPSPSAKSTRRVTLEPARPYTTRPYVSNRSAVSPSAFTDHLVRRQTARLALPQLVHPPSSRPRHPPHCEQVHRRWSAIANKGSEGWRSWSERVVQVGG